MKERPDAPAVTIARTEVVKPGNPPIAFTPTCDVATIQPKNRYVVRGRILVDGKLMFTTDPAVPVIAAGNPLQCRPYSSG